MISSSPGPMPARNSFPRLTSAAYRAARFRGSSPGAFAAFVMARAAIDCRRNNSSVTVPTIAIISTPRLASTLCATGDILNGSGARRGMVEAQCRYRGAGSIGEVVVRYLRAELLLLPVKMLLPAGK